MPLLEQVEFRPDTFQFIISPEENFLPGAPADVNTLSGDIAFLDSNWKEQGLTEDWYNLPNLPFWMKSQMKSLDCLDDDSIIRWTKQTGRMILGFQLEYLSDRNVFPYKYKKITQQSGNETFVDPLYDDTRDIIDIAKREERNGAVVDALEGIKSFFLDSQTVEGSIAVIVSPLGPTGMKSEKGFPIDYPDSYILLFQKTTDGIEGYTVQTDFSIQECRTFIQELTGTTLPEDADAERYVREFSHLTPLFNHKSVRTMEDIVRIMEKVRSSHSAKSPYAYLKDDKKGSKIIPWAQVYQDMDRAELLYHFDSKVTRIIDKWKRYQYQKEYLNNNNDGKNTLLNIQKGLAVTIWRLLESWYERKTNEKFLRALPYFMSSYSVPSATIYAYNNHADHGHESRIPLGEIEGWAKDNLPSGCAGTFTNNNSPMELLTIESIVPRLGIVKGEINNTNDSCPKIKCEYCGWVPNVSQVKAIQSGTQTACGNCGRKPS